MATADQIKSLIRSHYSEDTERFYTMALQLAAHEAQQGHSALAHDIREIVDKARSENGPRLLRFPTDLKGLVLSEEPTLRLSAMVLTPRLADRIKRVVHEYRQQQRLKSHGLTHRRRIMLIGPPGTGKTMSARVLAAEVGLTLYTVQVDKLVTKFMGETSAKLRQIFDLIQQELGVYLFDEFDAIAGERTLENDVGEMRRVLNAFLQFIDQDTSDSLVVAATNSPGLLDRALYRRFDDVLYFERPGAEDRRRLIGSSIGSFFPESFNEDAVVSQSEGLSHAEIVQACQDAIKHAILANKDVVDEATVQQALQDRSDASRRAKV